MSVEFYVCGTRGTFPIFSEDFEKYGQATNCYVLRDGDYAIIMDCGSGLANAASFVQDCKVIDVLFSHIHYDHIMGLYMVPNVFAHAETAFYGNFNAWSSITQKSRYGVHSFWPSMVTEYKQRPVAAGTEYPLHNGFKVTFTPAEHADGSMMMAITWENKRLCFTGDNEYSGGSEFPKWIQGCDLLLYDGSYSPEDYPAHKGWGHSSWDVGCQLARDNGVKKLLITHYSPEQSDAILSVNEQRAKEIFPGVEFARERTFYEIGEESAQMKTVSVQ